MTDRDPDYGHDCGPDCSCFDVTGEEDGKKAPLVHGAFAPVDSGRASGAARGSSSAATSKIGSASDEVKILGETAGGYIVDADGWSFESCPGCGTLVGEWLTEEGPDVMLLVECPMCQEASREEEWWF